MQYFFKQNKFKNKKIEHNGIIFDSKKEYSRYMELKLLEQAGIIKNLKRQVKYVLIPTQYEIQSEILKNGKIKENKKVIERECSYIADFVYEENDKTVVEDVKSEITKTPEYKIKKKLMLYIHKIKIKEI